MLSKFQAKLFFVLGSLLFTLVFLFLTYDSLKRIPEQTRQKNLTAEVIRGKDIWDKNNCMGCHTLLGEGAYYAPELTKVLERRGAEWIRVFIKDPQAMYPGERKMVKYNFTDPEIDDLIAFFKWIGEMDLNGFPPKPTLFANVNPPGVIAIGPGKTAVPQPEKFKQLCTACHMVGGAGGNVGPALDSVGKKFDAAYLAKWLNDPAKLKPGTKMPKLPLTDTEQRDIVKYLVQLK